MGLGVSRPAGGQVGEYLQEGQVALVELSAAAAIQDLDDADDLGLIHHGRGHQAPCMKPDLLVNASEKLRASGNVKDVLGLTVLEDVPRDP